MKKIFIIVLSLFLISLIGCVNLDNYVTIDEYSQLEEVYNTLKEDIENIKSDNLELEEEIGRLNNELDLEESRSNRLQTLITNLDSLLDNIYVIECTNSIGGTGKAKAFSVVYKDNIYVLTAGHLVSNENGLFSNFRVNLGNDWIDLNLLVYDNDYQNKSDYAIFEGSRIKDGFKVDLDNDRPLYFLGSSISIYTREAKEGESGSPVIDLDGEVTEIATTDLYSYNTDIDIVLEAIDELK